MVEDGGPTLQEILSANITSIESLTSTSYEEKNPFYDKMNWFRKTKDLEVFKQERLDKYFATPEGAVPEFDHIVRVQFMELFSWVDGSDVPEAYRAMVSYIRVSHATKRKYVKEFLNILKFAANLHLKPLTEPVKVSVPFGDLVEKLIETPSRRAILDVVIALVSQRLKAKRMTVLEAFLRFSCVDSKFNLKDPRYVQQVASRTIKFIKLGVLAYAGLHSGELDDEQLENIAAEMEEFAWEDLRDCSDDEESMAEDEAHSRDVEIPVDDGDDEGVDMGDILEKYSKFTEEKELAPIKVVIQVYRNAKTHSSVTEPRILRLENPNKIHFDLRELDFRGISRVFLWHFRRALQLIELLSQGANTTLKMTDLTDGKQHHALQHKASDAPFRVLEAVYTAKRSGSVVAVGKDKKLEFRDDFTSKYMALHDELESSIVVLVHLGGGMVGRATELVTYRFSEVAEMGRHVFRFMGHIFFEPEHSKNSWRTQTPKQKPIRFLDEELSVLFMRNFIFIRPFVDCLAKSLAKKTRAFQKYRGEYMTHVFVSSGFAIGAEQLRNTVVRGLSGDFPVSFSEYRQIVKFVFNEAKAADQIGFSKRVQNMLANNASCRQFDHSESTGTRHYGVSVDQHGGTNSLEFLAMLGVSEMWFKVLQLLYENMFGRTQSKLVSAPIAASERPSQKVSTSGCPAAPSENPLSLFPVAPRLASVDETELEGQLIGPLREDVRRQIQELFPGGGWKSEGQLQAVKMSVQSNRSFLCVLPTGGGKSLTFLMTAFSNPDLVTVVLTPTIALREQILQNAASLGLPCSDELQTKFRGLVVMAYEKLQKSVRLQGIAVGLAATNKIKRVFFEEAHTLASDGFRNPAHFLPYFSTLVPVTLLTATASPRITTALCELFRPERSFFEIRESTDRPNIEYAALEVSGSRRMQVMASEIIEVGGAAVVIFVSFQDDVAKVSKDLSTQAIQSVGFHADLSDLEKQANTQEWMSGRISVMVTTTALCAGIDLPSVRLVIMHGLPYCLEDLVQMCGRLGRDGKQGKGLLVFYEAEEQSRREGFREGSRQRCDLGAVLAYARSKRCRREFLNIAIDQQARNCQDPGFGRVLCDNCELLRAEGEAFIVEEEFRNSILSSGTHVELHENISRRVGESVRVTTFFAGNFRRCFFCRANQRDDRHCHSECHYLSRSCQICFYVSSFKEHVGHHYSKCPFKRMPDQTCGGCWVPREVEGQKFHKGDVSLNCGNYSAKLHWILKVSEVMKRAHYTASQFEKQFEAATVIDVWFPVGLGWFYHNVIIPQSQPSFLK